VYDAIYEVEKVIRGARSKRGESHSYFVYLLLCDDGSYYTGYTNNVALRFERHKKGYGARYTRLRRPERVVYLEEFKNRGAAIRRELRIKSLSHREKKALASTSSGERVKSD
jgi:putative endonuclease